MRTRPKDPTDAQLGLVWTTRNVDDIVSLERLDE
jgi:hypothetical protein